MAVIILKSKNMSDKNMSVSIIHEKWQVNILVNVQSVMYEMKHSILWIEC